MEKIIINEREYYYKKVNYVRYVENIHFEFFIKIDKPYGIYHFKRNWLGKLLRRPETWITESKREEIDVNSYETYNFVRVEDSTNKYTMFEEVFHIRTKFPNNNITDEPVKEKVRKAELSYYERSCGKTIII